MIYIRSRRLGRGECRQSCPLVIVGIYNALTISNKIIGRISDITDSVSLKHWLLRFRAVIRELRLIFLDFKEWLSNGQPPWDAYWATGSDCLIALEKHPGVRLVRVGKTWQLLITKCLLWVKGQEAKAACGTEQLAVGVEAGMEGGIHDMHALW